MEDIVKGATEGIIDVDPYGRRVKIFVDPVAFLGDYPATTEMGDCVGHTADRLYSMLSSKTEERGLVRSAILY